MIWMNPSYRILFVLAGALLGLVAFQPPPARAASPPPVYYVRADGADTANGLSWAAAKRTIQSAVSATPALHQVWVAQGTYKETIDIPSDLLLYGGFRGDETTTASRTLDAAATTIDGYSSASSSPPAVSMKIQKRSLIDGFRVTRGNLGIHATSDHWLTSQLVISNCHIDHNGGILGGGLYLYGVNSLLISRCKIRNNGAIHGGGLYTHFCGGRISDTEIVGNSAYMGGGGWVQLYMASLLFERCLIGANAASSQGGGFYVIDPGSSGKVMTLTDTLICGNSAFVGPAVYSSNDGLPPGEKSLDLNFQNCTLADNSGNQPTSGTISLSPSIALNLRNCILVSRRNALVENGRLSARNCLFQPPAGGAVYRMDPRLASGLPRGALPTYYGVGAINTLPGCAGNIQGDPGLVMNSSAATTGTWTSVVYDAKNNMTTLVDASARFTPGALVDRPIRPSDAFLGNAVIISNTATAILLRGDWRDDVSAGQTYRLVDYHLSPASAALDRGDPAFATPSDYEGDPRPGSDGKVDIGADEAPAGLTPPPLAPVADNDLPFSHVDPLPANLPARATLGIHVFDPGSAVASVQLYYRYARSGDWRRYDSASTTQTVQIDFDAARAAGPGAYDFYSIATDCAGNVEAKTPRVETRSVFGLESPRGQVIRFLLGIDANPAGLDTNADGRIDICDSLGLDAKYVPCKSSPADGAKGVAPRLALYWLTVAPLATGRCTYDIYCWPASAPRPALPTARGLTQTWVQSQVALTGNTLYKWQVVTRVGSWQCPGPVWSFTTAGSFLSQN